VIYSQNNWPQFAPLLLKQTQYLVFYTSNAAKIWYQLADNVTLSHCWRIQTVYLVGSGGGMSCTLCIDKQLNGDGVTLTLIGE
jgi:hypothetical protein